MPKPNQIVAGRGLIGWSQADLANACKISVKSINLIEGEKQNPSQDTMTAIELAFDRQGVVFHNNGVFLEDRRTAIFEGNNRFKLLFEDIEFSNTEEHGLMIDGADESKTPAELVAKVIELRKAGLKMKHLIKDQDRFMRGPVTEYRWLPADTFVNQSIFIYGNSVALASETEPKVYVHRDLFLAEFHRSRFHLLWQILDQPDYTEATDVFPI